MIRGLQEGSQALDLVGPAVWVRLCVEGLVGGASDNPDRLDGVRAVRGVEVAVLAFDLGEVDAPGILGAGEGRDAVGVLQRDHTRRVDAVGKPVGVIARRKRLAQQTDREIHVVVVDVLQAAAGVGRIEDVGHLAGLEVVVAARVLAVVAQDQSNAPQFRQVLFDQLVVRQETRRHHFVQKQPAVASQANEFVGLAHGARERLFAQDVLAMFESRPGLLEVQAVGRRNVHVVDRRIGEQRFQIGVDLFDSERVGQRSPLAFVARIDGFAANALRPRHTGQDLADDRTCANRPDTNVVHRCPPRVVMDLRLR